MKVAERSDLATVCKTLLGKLAERFEQTVPHGPLVTFDVDHRLVDEWRHHVKHLIRVHRTSRFPASDGWRM